MSKPSREIRIVTGPGGLVRGSKVYLDGQELTGLRRFELIGEIDDHWILGMVQGLSSSGSIEEHYIDMEEDRV